MDGNLLAIFTDRTEHKTSEITTVRIRTFLPFEKGRNKIDIVKHSHPALENVSVRQERVTDKAPTYKVLISLRCSFMMK